MSSFTAPLKKRLFWSEPPQPILVQVPISNLSTEKVTLQDPWFEGFLIRLVYLQSAIVYAAGVPAPQGATVPAYSWTLGGDDAISATLALNSQANVAGVPPEFERLTWSHRQNFAKTFGAPLKIVLFFRRQAISQPAIPQNLFVRADFNVLGGLGEIRP